MGCPTIWLPKPDRPNGLARAARAAALAAFAAAVAAALLLLLGVAVDDLVPLLLLLLLVCGLVSDVCSLEDDVDGEVEVLEDSEDIGGACSCCRRLEAAEDLIEELCMAAAAAAAAARAACCCCSCCWVCDGGDPPTFDDDEAGGVGEGPLKPLRRSRTVLRLFLLTVWMPWTGGGLWTCTGLTWLGIGPGLGAILAIP